MTDKVYPIHEHTFTVSDAVMKKMMPQILSALPEDWRGTTFANSDLLGRELFSKKLAELVSTKETAGETITAEDLSLKKLGNAEDYMRVATNLSTTLELALARTQGFHVDQVFSFASRTMPLVAVLLAMKKPVVLYVAERDSALFTEAFITDTLSVLCGEGAITCKIGEAPVAQAGSIVLKWGWDGVDEAARKVLSGVIDSSVLYIVDEKAINHEDILVIRKRLSTPLTTPAAEEMLQKYCGEDAKANQSKPSPEDLTKFNGHLQELCGTAVNAGANPVVFTAGLPAIASTFITLIARGGCDVLMCSTAYGGSSQMTDVLQAAVPTKLRKSKFHIQGEAPIVPSIQTEMDKLAAKGDDLLPVTVLFVEIPTNPDMKVPDVPNLAKMCVDYQTKTKKQVLLFIDTTFAPGSKILAQLKDAAPDLMAMCFISMSKSVSRGITTAGTIVANHTALSIDLLGGIRTTAEQLDTIARSDQFIFLCENHEGVEERCRDAYEVAKNVGDNLCLAVKMATKKDMKLNFVSKENSEKGFTSSTFSFNLPSPEGATADDTEALAQRFVDYLHGQPTLFKPCVSFGQDNGLVYATVPATSTQGAIKPEDKAKQAVGGVQLVRLSFPPATKKDGTPGCNVELVSAMLAFATNKLYSQSYGVQTS